MTEQLAINCAIRGDHAVCPSCLRMVPDTCGKVATPVKEKPAEKPVEVPVIEPVVVAEKPAKAIKETAK